MVMDIAFISNFHELECFCGCFEMDRGSLLQFIKTDYKQGEGDV
jgi:hypothetical protein